MYSELADVDHVAGTKVCPALHTCSTNTLYTKRDIVLFIILEL